MTARNSQHRHAYTQQQQRQQQHEHKELLRLCGGGVHSALSVWAHAHLSGGQQGSLKEAERNPQKNGNFLVIVLAVAPALSVRGRGERQGGEVPWPVLWGRTKWHVHVHMKADANNVMEDLSD